MNFSKPKLDMDQAGNIVMVAPVDGETIPLKDFPDPVFAQGLLGTGIGFMPKGEVLVAPTSAEVISVFPGGHALVMKSTDGLELLLHIGLDTVDLNGQGFTPLVVDGDIVKPGQPLIKFNREVIRQAGKELHTALIVTNKEVIADYALIESSQVRAGETQVFAVKPVQ